LLNFNNGEVMPVSQPQHSPEPFSCSVALQRLQQRLDREQIGDAEFEQHLIVCSECRGWYLTALQVLETLQTAPSPEPSPELTNRIFDAVVLMKQDGRSLKFDGERGSEDTSNFKPQRGPRRFLRRWAYAGGSLVASVLVVGMAYLMWFQSPEQLPQVPDPHRNVVEVPDPAPKQVVTPLQESLSTAGELAWRLPKRMLGEERPAVPVLPSISLPELPMVEPSTPPLEPAAQAISEVTSGVAIGFEPVSSSAKKMFDHFWKELGPSSALMNPEN
jgi:hypothetical protein